MAESLKVSVLRSRAYGAMRSVRTGPADRGRGKRRGCVWDASILRGPVCCL